MSTTQGLKPAVTVAAAARSEPLPGQFPDKTALATSADPQLRSDFFSHLPSEIRQMIYVEMWRTTGSLRLHILDSGSGHVPCLIDSRADDVRYLRFQNATGDERQKWESRCKSEWCLHWACKEASHSKAACKSPFLPVLLTSKRMYLEAHPTIFTSIAFIFTDTIVANSFLSAPQWGPSTFHAVELCLRAGTIMVELYHPNASQELSFTRSPGRPFISTEKNPWERLCKSLAGQEDLRELRLWFDCKDLRPWHKRFAETRFFQSLWSVKARNFTLALPRLPTRRGLEDAMFLEGDNLEGAPFDVERGPRPNNWAVHLSSMNEMLMARQAPE